MPTINTHAVDNMSNEHYSADDPCPVCHKLKDENGVCGCPESWKGKDINYFIHKGIKFAESKAIKTSSEPYRSGAGFGYSCGYQDGLKAMETAYKIELAANDACRKRIAELETGVRSFIDWMKIHRSRVTELGAPIQVLIQLFNPRKG